MKIVAPFFAAFAFACGVPTNTQCTDVAVAGITVYVFDQSSGDAICDATVIITDGSYTETLREVSTSSTCYYEGAYERAGTYDLAVTAANKSPASESGIVVPEGTCHVLAQTVTIQM